MTHLRHIESRLCGRPLLLLPEKLDTIAQVLAGRLSIDVVKPELGLEIPLRPESLAARYQTSRGDASRVEASRFVGSKSDPDTGRLPYLRTASGTALVTITGALVNRGAYIGASMSGLASYEGIAAQLRAAASDPKVGDILLDLDTPGGEATGAFELADLVRAVAEAKPVTAFVNGMAASAGYAIASGARRIVSVPSGLTGSIGVVMLHADYSRALANAGIATTFIHAGAHKVDGNPYEPLSPDVKAALQAEVEQLYGLFVDKVAAGRGRRLSAKAARDTQARTFYGAEAKAVGLVDDLADFDTLYADLARASARSSRKPSDPRSKSMSDYTSDDLVRARAEGKSEGHKDGLAAGRLEGHRDGHAEGLAAGATAERARIKAIVDGPEAKGREALAAHYAYATGDTPAQAEAALKASGKAAPADSLAGRMQQQFHTADASRKAPSIDRDAIYARQNSRNGG